MNPPFDHKDLLWRNRLLSEATKRSSALLQQTLAPHNGFREYRSETTNPVARTVPQILRGLDPGHYSPSSTLDPQHRSMLRLMMLRNQAHETLNNKALTTGAIKIPNGNEQGFAAKPYPSIPQDHDALHLKHEAQMGRGLPPQTRPVPQVRDVVSLPRSPFMDTGTVRPAETLRPMNGTSYPETTLSLADRLETFSREKAASAAGVYDAKPTPAPKEQKPKPKPAKKPKNTKKRKVDGQKTVVPAKKDAKWMLSLAQLAAYKEEYGDCVVPRGFAPNPRLASWVAEQRKQYKLLSNGKQSSITPARIAFLNELGFAWNAQDAAWERHFEDLQRFKDEYGDCLVPLGNPRYPKLGLWIKEQRRHFTLMKQGKKSHMTKERALALDSIGFCWDTHEQIWSERLRDLCAYRAVYGDCLVSTNAKSSDLGTVKLATWVHHQRRQYKKFKEGKPSHITPERIRALEAIDFVWDPRKGSPDNLSDGYESDSGDSSSHSSLDTRPSKRRRF